MEENYSEKQEMALAVLELNLQHLKSDVEKQNSPYDDFTKTKVESRIQDIKDNIAQEYFQGYEGAVDESALVFATEYHQMEALLSQYDYNGLVEQMEKNAVEKPSLIQNYGSMFERIMGDNRMSKVSAIASIHDNAPDTRTPIEQPLIKIADINLSDEFGSAIIRYSVGNETYMESTTGADHFQNMTLLSWNTHADADTHDRNSGFIYTHNSGDIGNRIEAALNRHDITVITGTLNTTESLIPIDIIGIPLSDIASLTEEELTNLLDEIHEANPHLAPITVDNSQQTIALNAFTHH